MLYLRRLDGGVFTLQLIDYIILGLCVSEIRDISARIMKILSTRGSSSLAFSVWWKGTQTTWAVGRGQKTTLRRKGSQTCLKSYSV